jgi:hypothetical protein
VGVRIVLVIDFVSSSREVIALAFLDSTAAFDNLLSLRLEIYASIFVISSLLLNFEFLPRLFYII